MKAWTLAIIVLLIGVSGANVVATVRRVPPPPRLASAVPINGVIRHERRMAAVRRALEVRGARGTIGYMADVPAAQLATDSRGMEEYFLSQFALVPWVMDAKAQEREWLVANLHATSISERAPAGYRVTDDCGGGVYLLRRTERQAP